MHFNVSIKSRRNHFLASAALGLLLGVGIAGDTFASGGSGGGPGEGAGGVGNSGAAGGNGTAPANAQGGGGGGGAGGGGDGGNGGHLFAFGGNGGTAIAPNGTSPTPGDGGGGGGGGFSGLTQGGSGGAGGNGIPVTFNGAVGSDASHIGEGGGGGGGGGSGLRFGGTGGSGGNGGSSDVNGTANTAGVTLNVSSIGGGGGGGGDGGIGNLQAGSFNVNVFNTGGSGGNGGRGGDGNALGDGGSVTNVNVSAAGGRGGNGGAGGAAITVTGSNATVVESGSLLGGQGGVGGDGGDARSTYDHTVGANSQPSVGGVGGNGGSGGAAAMFLGSNVSFTNTSAIVAGVGGSGGAGGFGATAGPFGSSGSTLSAGGAGGVGGIAVWFNGFNSSLTNTGSIMAGNGGNAGAGDGAVSGGNGGGAVAFFGNRGTVINSGTITGGNGGMGVNGAAASVGGYGVFGAFLTINNTGGTIIGGLGETGIRQSAIRMIGGDNFVGTGGTITGGILVDLGSFAPALADSVVGQTLNVTGDVTLKPGVTYNVRINGAANDSITTNTTAQITNAKVVATVTGGNVLGRHTIVTAGAIGGTFSGVTLVSGSAFLSAALAYDPTHAYLDIVGSAANGGIDFTTAAQTTNQRNVASALNSGGSANGYTGPLINFIAGLNAVQAQSAFTQLDGEVATGAQRAAFRFGDQFLNLMLSPFVDGHFDGAGGITGYAAEAREQMPEEIAQAYAAVFKAPQPQNFEQRWSLWNAGFGGSGNTKGDPVTVGSNDTRLSTWGFAGGMDYRFSPSTTVGLAAAGGSTNWGLSNALGNGRSESAQVGAYARTRIGAA